MPKYLLKVSYTADGAKGLLKDGGSKRREAAQGVVRSVGGSMEAFYYAFGSSDVYAIVDVPDAASAAAMSIALSASGSVTSELVVLLTHEEIDAAVKKTPSYTPPGR
ncbi:MAG TPA: GYD domain-containing protein [Vicinamibacterales bacterium]|nr:GYD domain-containing protein [Vicinamibacterales bacterium]